MNRLTAESTYLQACKACPAGVSDSCNTTSCSRVCAAISLLHAYEETGLTPAEITALKVKYGR